MNRFLAGTLLLFFPFTHYTQVSVKDSSIFTPLVMSSYSAQYPGGDLARRFGWNSSLGLGLMFKMKSNFLWGAEGQFFFGDQLREKGILDSINTHDGFIINQDGEYADVRLWERGFSAFATFGKVLSFWNPPNPNSGVFFMFGAGYMQHKIRIEDIGNKSVQLSKEYKKGYDRLTGGFAIKQSIGYVYLGNKRMVNFFGSIECIQGFTRSQRSWDYDLMLQDTNNRLDLQFGIRVGWILPLFKKSSTQFYYD